MRVLFLILAGCAPPGPDVGPEGFVDITPHLFNSPADYPERTRPFADVQGSLQPGGEPLYGETWASPLQNYAVVEVDDALAVLWQAHGYAIVTWLDRSDVADVPVETSWFGSSDAGVRLPAGTIVDVVDRRETRIRVMAEKNGLVLDAWVPHHLVDQWFYDDGEPDAWEPKDGPLVSILPEVTLHAGPGGAPIGHVERAFPAVEVEERDGWVRVHGSAGDWALDAWVYEDDLIERTWLRGFGGGWGCGGSGIALHTHHTIRADAWLHDGPNGPIVGRTLQDLRRTLAGDPGGWRSATFDTPFGTAELWVDPADVLRADLAPPP